MIYLKVHPFRRSLILQEHGDIYFLIELERHFKTSLQDLPALRLFAQIACLVGGPKASVLSTLDWSQFHIQALDWESTHTHKNMEHNLFGPLKNMQAGKLILLASYFLT